MKDDDKNKKKEKSIHPFDVWPPPPEPEEVDPPAGEAGSKPRNSSYKDLQTEYTEEIPEVYEVEQKEDIKRKEDSEDVQKQKDHT